MRQTKPVAMIAAGSVARSPISRLTALAERLGPVKASSFRVASRIVNTIRAGRPVHDVTAFANCPLILICVPDRLIEAAVTDLETAQFELADRQVVLCDSLRDTSVLAPLAARGARTASINVVASCVITEGDLAAAREFRRELLGRATRLFSLAPGAKPLFFAGLDLAALPSYLAAGASTCLQMAGIPVGQSRKIVQALAVESVRAYTKGGSKALEAGWDDERWRSVRNRALELRDANPGVARFYATTLQASRRLIGNLPDLPEDCSIADVAG